MPWQISQLDSSRRNWCFEAAKTSIDVHRKFHVIHYDDGKIKLTMDLVVPYTVGEDIPVKAAGHNATFFSVANVSGQASNK